jgi:hypothetical protein
MRERLYSMADRRYDPIEWPTNVRRCSGCKALPLDADVDGHEAWHEALDDALAEALDEDAIAGDMAAPQRATKMYLWCEAGRSASAHWLAVAPDLDTARFLFAEEPDRPPRGRAITLDLQGDAEVQWFRVVSRNE